MSPTVQDPLVALRTESNLPFSNASLLVNRASHTKQYMSSFSPAWLINVVAVSKDVR